MNVNENCEQNVAYRNEKGKYRRRNALGKHTNSINLRRMRNRSKLKENQNITQKRAQKRKAEGHVPLSKASNPA